MAIDVPEAYVRAAIDAARAAGADVADVPVAVVAQAAGVSRSTLLRRIGGTRAALDEAVRAAGVDPGGRPPVRDRAIDAAAALMSENDLASATMDAVAVQADCSVESLYSIFGNRDQLIAAAFERHSPLRELEHFLDQPHGDLRSTVLALYRKLAESLTREPRIMPALLAEGLARSESATTRAVLEHSAPRMLVAVGGWVSREIAAGHLRELPLPIIVQLLTGPYLAYWMLGRSVTSAAGIPLPPIEEAAELFTDAFLRAAGTASDADCC